MPKPPAVVLLARSTSPLHRSKMQTMTRVARNEFHTQSVVVAPKGTLLTPTLDGDHFIHVSSFDQVDTVRAAVRDLAERYDVKQVFPLFEREVETAAWCRQDLGILQGIRPEAARRFRDKEIMHQEAAALGITTPDSCRPRHLNALMTFFREHGQHIFIKPRDGSGSRNTHEVRTVERLEQVWARIASDVSAYRFEAAVPGVQYHVDTLMRGGEILWSGLGRYPDPLHSFRDSDRLIGTITRRHGLSMAEQHILDVNARLLRGLGLATGIAHTEFFLTPSGKVVLGETAARTGGGPVEATIEASHQINLSAEWMRLELNPNHRPMMRHGPEVGGIFLPSAPAGRINAISSANDLLAHPDVVGAEIWYGDGDSYEGPDSCVGMLGMFWMKGPNFGELREMMRLVRDTRFALHMQPWAA